MGNAKMATSVTTLTILDRCYEISQSEIRFTLISWGSDTHARTVNGGDVLMHFPGFPVHMEDRGIH